MIGSVILKTIKDRRWFTLGWTLGFALLAFVMVVFYPAMNTEDALAGLTQNMPKAFEGLMGDLSHLSHFSTYLASQLFDIRGSIFAGVLAIILGLNLTVGDEDKGYMRTLLAMPISRGRLLIEKWLGMLIIMAIVSLGILVTILISAPLIEETAQAGWLVRLVFGQWLTMAAIGSLVFGAGIASGQRAVATLVGVAVVATSFILSTFSVAVDWLKDWTFLSVYHYFPAVTVAKDGFAATDTLILGALIGGTVAVGWLVFRNRDVNG